MDANLTAEDVGRGWYEHAMCRGRRRREKQRNTRQKNM